MTLENLLSNLVDRGGARTVYGDPVTSGDITVVPVARIAYGFGMGQGRGGRDDQQHEGGGGGAGFAGKPAGYIEIGPRGSRWVPIDDRKRLAAALGLGFILGLIAGRRGSDE